MVDVETRTTERSRLGELDLDDFVFGEIFSDHMFSMVYEDGAWRRPEIVPYGPIAIEPGVMMLHYAQMVFEGLKAFRGVDGIIRIFRPDRNARRLRESCRRMCIPEIGEQVFVDAVEQLFASIVIGSPIGPATRSISGPSCSAPSPISKSGRRRAIASSS